ncbi:ABC transporter ATP-binding protein [Thalassotalea sp. HSM 43]|uniref:ABC transporter ATP-binding protein n=1 Tax=Thalassotalea sp. HSM 43 TaxID=2552945 RepID=UPI001082277F|nr:ABC transporter ATP-binding protein [Thalassotalea sp. HSM 43]QBY03610.1 ABC transporter ATP-binding protein [Thalassotalea sp. HSM 43]
MAKHNILTVNNLVKHYGQVKAVDGINFNVEQGMCFGLLGPNGAGKTTTIEIMEGILTADSGDVVINSDSDKPFNELIGIQFQHTALQDFLTVRETLNLFASFYEQHLAIEELLELCQLNEFIDRDSRLLSGGQRQRLLLALALINDPKIVFLDEPTTGLDPHSRRQFWQLIKRIKGQGKTVILTTHYMDEAEQLCDQIAIMDQGKIIEQGAPQALLDRHFQQVFMYLPLDNVSTQIIDVNQWQIRDNRVEIKSTDVEQTVSQLLALAIPLTGLHIKSANLDDLFLKLTGHSLGGEYD